MDILPNNKANFGTLPVFLTAISTILGAIMFLRFGFALGTLGFWGTMVIILIGHAVTIPTAMAIAEIATNQKVEGGGEYYIISRSFGINIGAAIGIALFFSQAISVAFYVIAFAESFNPLYDWINTQLDWQLSDKRIISLPALILLSWLMLSKGSSLGMKVLYVVVVTLFLSLLLFFLGQPAETTETVSSNLLGNFQNKEEFFVVFAIVFPGFTGMTAGVGLSGDLKDPSKSIPWGTIMATFTGMVIYILIAYKLAISASEEQLLNNPLVMSDVAIWPAIIPLGLAAATISSALGSIMVAPRTLQALAGDKVLPLGKGNRWMAHIHSEIKEPVNATLITVIIALVFVSIGDVNFVAGIISMFFMVTYGALCTISFFQHFAADPSYRPAFKSRWYISLLGAVLCFYLMFKMNTGYALIALIAMTIIYFAITKTKGTKAGMAKIFQGVIFQFSRRLQVFLQKTEKDEVNSWRPSVICISEDSFSRPAAYELMNWLSHRYGFGTYIHFIHGYFSKESNHAAKDDLNRMINIARSKKSNVYIDTMISPSYTSAIAQALQLPSISGKEVNMFLFEFSKSEPDNLKEIIENFTLVKAGNVDTIVLASSEKGFANHREIHIWITQNDFANASLMILLGYIILGHPDWKRAQIKIFAIFPDDEIAEQKSKLITLIKTGRLPISMNNIELITLKPDVSKKDVINKKSKDADLTVVGFRGEALKQLGAQIYLGYDGIGNILFVNASQSKLIE